MNCESTLGHPSPRILPCFLELRLVSTSRLLLRCLNLLRAPFGFAAPAGSLLQVQSACWHRHRPIITMRDRSSAQNVRRPGGSLCLTGCARNHSRDAARPRLRRRLPPRQLRRRSPLQRPRRSPRCHSPRHWLRCSPRRRSPRRSPHHWLLRFPRHSPQRHSLRHSPHHTGLARARAATLWPGQARVPRAVRRNIRDGAAQAQRPPKRAATSCNALVGNITPRAYRECGVSASTRPWRGRVRSSECAPIGQWRVTAVVTPPHDVCKPSRPRVARPTLPAALPNSPTRAPHAPS